MRTTPATLTMTSDEADLTDYLDRVLVIVGADHRDVPATFRFLDALLDIDETVAVPAGVTGFSRVLTMATLAGMTTARDTTGTNPLTVAAGAAVAHVARRVVDTATDTQRSAWASVADGGTEPTSVAATELAAAAQLRLAVA